MATHVEPPKRDGAPRAQDAATRVLIVDDHTAFCDALAMAIDLQDDLVCIGGAASLREAMATIDGNPPDVILMDVHLPDGDGIEATARIRSAAPDALILILTGHADAGILARAAAAGASGFLPKESPIATVLQSIRAVRRGAMLIDGAVLATLLERMVPALAPVPKPESKDDDLLLTQRERDVLQLMAEGQNSHAIAIALNISLHTCRGYQKSVMAKLDAHSQLEAVVMATRRHLVRLAV
jgi:DNA-binding NarL/FixJ family response regulator